MSWRRERPPADDVRVLWWGNSSDLVDRLQEFIADIRGLDLTADQVADQLDELLTNPGPRSHHTELGDPPRPPLQPTTPVLALPPLGEHVARRAPDPGE